jgi:hypothetical protein
VILLIQSYGGANHLIKPFWPYYAASGADEIVGVGTKGDCVWPNGVKNVEIGINSYINGEVLPKRLLDTLAFGLTTEHEHILISEYDTLYFHEIRYQAMEHAVAAHRAGGQTFGSIAQAFYHNPWLFRREVAEKFIRTGTAAIRQGVCNGTAEQSPDVFFGLCVERANLPVQDNLWREYSRNRYDIPGHLKQARQAYLDGASVIHGLKTIDQLEYILS